MLIEICSKITNKLQTETFIYKKLFYSKIIYRFAEIFCNTLLNTYRDEKDLSTVEKKKKK